MVMNWDSTDIPAELHVKPKAGVGTAEVRSTEKSPGWQSPGSPNPGPRCGLRQHQRPQRPAHPLGLLLSETQSNEGGELICFLSRT